MRGQKYLLCARAVGTHGVRGTLRMENYTDSPQVLCSLKTVYTKKPGGDFEPVKVEKAFRQKEAVLMKLEGIETLEEAIVCKGREFFADRDDIMPEDGGFFIADVVGLPVVSESDGEIVGKVTEVLTGRIQDIYVIEDVNGGSFMVPYVPDFITRVVTDGEDAGVYVNLIEGMRG